LWKSIRKLIDATPPKNDNGRSSLSSLEKKALDFLKQCCPAEPEGFLGQFMAEFVINDPNLDGSR
jgi:hypothetical protein